MSDHSTGLVSLMGQLPSCRYQKVNIGKEEVQHRHTYLEGNLSGVQCLLRTLNSSPKNLLGEQVDADNPEVEFSVFYMFWCFSGSWT